MVHYYVPGTMPCPRDLTRNRHNSYSEEPRNNTIQYNDNIMEMHMGVNERRGSVCGRAREAFTNKGKSEAMHDPILYEGENKQTNIKTQSSGPTWCI